LSRKFTYEQESFDKVINLRLKEMNKTEEDWMRDVRRAGSGDWGDCRLKLERRQSTFWHHK